MVKLSPCNLKSKGHGFELWNQPPISIREGCLQHIPWGAALLRTLCEREMFRAPGGCFSLKDILSLWWSGSEASKECGGAFRNSHHSMAHYLSC